MEQHKCHMIMILQHKWSCHGVSGRECFWRQGRATSPSGSTLHLSHLLCVQGGASVNGVPWTCLLASRWLQSMENRNKTWDGRRQRSLPSHTGWQDCMALEQASISEVLLVGLAMASNCFLFLLPGAAGATWASLYWFLLTLARPLKQSHHSASSKNSLECEVCFLLDPSGY